MGEASNPGPDRDEHRNRALAALAQLGFSPRPTEEAGRQEDEHTQLHGDATPRPAPGTAALEALGFRAATGPAHSRRPAEVVTAGTAGDAPADLYSPTCQVPSDATEEGTGDRLATPRTPLGDTPRGEAAEAEPQPEAQRRRIRLYNSGEVSAGQQPGPLAVGRVAVPGSVPSGAEEAVAEADEDFVEAVNRRPPRVSWERWAAVDFEAALREPVLTMKEPPRWFRGSLQRAYGIALEEWQRNNSTASWALFLFVPRLLLTPTSKKGVEGRDELTRRFDRFLRGEWAELMAETQVPARQQQRPRGKEEEEPAAAMERKLEAACNKVRQGEVSRARQLLTSSGLAPGNAATLTELRDPARRPRELSSPISAEAFSHEPANAFALDNEQLYSCLCTARKGRAADLSGTRLEHLRVLLDNEEQWHRFSSMAQAFARGEAPQQAMELMRQGRMTALKKKDGRARGIVTGCALRRLVSKAMARQCASLFCDATAPFQFALKTRAGTDAVAHAIRALTDADPNLVVLSLDGIGAYDHIRRAAFLQALHDDPQLANLLPLVRKLYTTPSTYLWTDDKGEVHEVHQGEGGEQGDPLMPALYSLGQHAALKHAATLLLPGEHLFAFLDDLYLVCRRDRAAQAFRTVADSVEERAGVQTHLGKLKAWCSGGGAAPADLAALGPEVWTADLPAERNGIMVLGRNHRSG